jgi:uncharacterized protein (TIGR03435 family)
MDLCKNFEPAKRRKCRTRAVTLGGFLFFGVPILAQATAPLAAPKPMSASNESPAFEVSVVRLNKTGDSGSHSNFQDGRFTATNVLLKNVLHYQAYGVPELRILGGPKWINSQRFDIEAKTDSTIAEELRKLGRDEGRAVRQEMFQKLLADRFKLAVHWETRTLPIYALVVARQGSKLEPAKQSDHSSGTSAGYGSFTARNLALDEIAQALTQELSDELGRPIVDKTGIQGRYDATLKWAPDKDPDPRSGGAASSAPAADAEPALFTAIQEQLGLKLESAKGPVKVLVIDHVEMPSEN